jgi:hypothetical protein
VRVSARSLTERCTVIAVNTASTTVTRRINVDGIAGRSATVSAAAARGRLDDRASRDTFGPLDARCT